MRTLNQNETYTVAGSLCDSQLGALITLSIQSFGNVAIQGLKHTVNHTNPASFLRQSVPGALVNIALTAIGHEVANYWLERTKKNNRSWF